MSCQLKHNLAVRAFNLKIRVSERVGFKVQGLQTKGLRGLGRQGLRLRSGELQGFGPQNLRSYGCSVFQLGAVRVS